MAPRTHLSLDYLLDPTRTLHRRVSLPNSQSDLRQRDGYLMVGPAGLEPATYRIQSTRQGSAGVD